MRPSDFFIEDEVLGGRRLNEGLIAELRRQPLPDHNDLEVAVPLAQLVHADLEAYGSSGGDGLR